MHNKIFGFSTIVLFILLLSLFIPAIVANAPVELSYDDGDDESVERSIVLGGQFAVKFSLPAGWDSATVTTAKYYLAYVEGYSADFTAVVYDSSKNVLCSQSAHPTANGWFNLPLNVTVDGDFYISIKWISGAPLLGRDNSSPDERSYIISSSNIWFGPYTNYDWMIRAVVSQTTEELTVDVDIKPGSDPNSVNLEDQGVLTVAVLGSEDLDATCVDPSTVELDGVSLATRGKMEKLAFSLEDVNLDGYDDFVAKFNVQDLVDADALNAATTELELTGELYNGTPILGTDTVNIVPPQ